MPDGPDEKLMPWVKRLAVASLFMHHIEEPDELCTGRCHFLFLFSRFFCVATFRRRINLLRDFLVLKNARNFGEKQAPSCLRGQ